MLGPDITLGRFYECIEYQHELIIFYVFLFFFSSFFLFHVALVVDLGSPDDLVAGGSPLRPVSSH